MWRQFVVELQGEIRPFTESVAGQGEDGLQEGQSGLEKRPDGLLCHAGQPLWVHRESSRSLNTVLSTRFKPVSKVGQSSEAHTV